jgi:DNA-binding response OmpR family regulator
VGAGTLSKMTTPTVEQQNAELKDRVDTLEEEIRQIRKALMPRLLFPLAWNLNRGETAVLACLYTSPDGFRSNEILRATAILSMDANGANVAPVRIYNLRKKLGPLGVVITNRPGEGYVLPAQSREIIKAALKRESE